MLLSPYSVFAKSSALGYIEGFSQDGLSITGWTFDPAGPSVVSLRVLDIKTGAVYTFRSDPKDLSVTRNDVTDFLSKRFSLSPENPPKSFAIPIFDKLPQGNFRILNGWVNGAKLKMTSASTRLFPVTEAKPRLLFFDRLENSITGWAFSQDTPLTLTLTLESLKDPSITETITITPSLNRPDVSEFLKNRYGITKSSQTTGFSYDLSNSKLPEGGFRITSVLLNQRAYPNPDLFPKGKKIIIRKLQVCPEAWYLDKMPKVYPSNDTSENEYLIVNGKKAGLKDYDLDWIKAKCQVNKPTLVY